MNNNNNIQMPFCTTSKNIIAMYYLDGYASHNRQQSDVN